MLTFNDCLALCELTEAEVAAIAEHENLPQLPGGRARCLSDDRPGRRSAGAAVIVEDIQAAQERGDLARAATLKRTLRQFIDEHQAKARGG